MWVRQISRLIYGRHLGEIFNPFVTVDGNWRELMLNKFILINTICCSKG
jgi:hypothetical protein